MKHIILLSTILFSTFMGIAQSDQSLFLKKSGKKGSMYLYWGWNRGYYTKSDITFEGSDYNFTLENVEAKDRQSPFGYDPYFKISQVTIPQYNFRLGYFINDHYDISFGIDHMKYVVQGGQTVKMTGHVDDPNNPFYGNYDNADQVLSEDFLQLEHTDGLNYLNVEVRRFDELYSHKLFSINLTEGIGAGPMMPKTNSKLMGMDRNDEFHIAGIGTGAMVGLNFTFLRYFYVQGEYKLGYIHMWDIKTSPASTDRACQSIFYNQFMMVFGLNLYFSDFVKE